MSKEKQIEEMAKLTCNSQRSCYEGDCIGSEICAVRENCEKLYNAGYRKQSDYRQELIEAFENYISEMTVSKWGTKDECETARAAVRMAVAFVLGEPQKMKGGAEETQVTTKKFFSPEDVREMSQKEVHENYQAIRDSMKEWK